MAPVGSYLLGTQTGDGNRNADVNTATSLVLKAVNTTSPMPVTALVSMTGISESTLHAAVRLLASTGMVQETPSGVLLTELGMNARALVAS